MQLTKIQKTLLERLREEGREIDAKILEEKYGINISDSVREGAFFGEQGYIEFQKKVYLEIVYTPFFEELRDSNLPELTLLEELEKKGRMDKSDLESIIRKKDIGLALNELKKLELISIEMGSIYIDEKGKEKKPPIKSVTYKPNDKKAIIKERNTLLQRLKTQDNFEPEYKEVLGELEKRKLIKIKERSKYTLKLLEKAGELEFRDEGATLLTSQMIKDGSWRDLKFKAYDPSIGSKKLISGKLHPLRQLALVVERIFRDMGYEFMAGGLVADSFHNFDALFTPQDHPAREMQDTFYIEHPRHCKDFPNRQIVKRVKETHEASFQYEWDYEVAKQNILRTHTTAVTAKQLEERNNAPLKLFSIGRVFRNEKIDAMHLPEFHQIEGVVIGDVNLRDLMGHISSFYKRIGLADITFKKTFNPYTEPSMEIYAYHPGLNKQIEVGNSGMFRPEMLAQFGYEKYRAIAWGLALERLASIIYSKSSIKELIGTEVDIDWLRGENKLWL